MIIRDYWSYLIRNNHQINYVLFDDYWIDYLPLIIPIIKRVKTKCEYLVLFWQRFNTWQQLLFDLFDDYLMIIWSLFALLWLFVTLKCERERLTRFRIRQATLPHNTGGQACTFSEDSLRFDCRIAAKRPPHTRVTRPRWTHHTQLSSLSPWFTSRARESGDLGREKEG